jgi:hypothetical protein
MSQAKDSQELKKALNYLRSGNLKPARAILVEVLRRDKNNANAWYLLVFTLKSRRQKFMALGRALKINPYHEKAKKLLDQLTGKTDIPQPVSPELPPTGIDEVLPTTIAPVPETPEEIPPPTPEEPPPVVERIPDPDLLDLPVRVSTPTDDTYVPGIRTNDVFEAPPLQAHPSEKSQSKRHLHRTIMAGMLIIVLIVVSWIAFGQDLLSTTPESVGLPVGGLISTNTPTPTNRSSTGIQPTWTPTPSPTATETPLPSPTVTATVEPTSPPLHPNITILMNSMQTQIADLRGLEVVDDVSSNIISRSIAQPFLSDLYLTDDLSTSIRNHEIALSMLGLIEPTYDLSSNTLNGMIGGLDGFYLGDKNEIYIIGLGFTPAEKITYAREYDIALVYHHHNLNQLKNNCASSQSCKALQALYLRIPSGSSGT